MEGNRRKGKNRAVYIVVAVLIVLTAALVVLICTSEGRRFTTDAAAAYIHDNINYIPSSRSDGSEQASSAWSEGTLTGTPSSPSEEGEYYHILLLGEEAMYTVPGKGRTDLIMLATINVPAASVQLVSLLRDTYVSIPGYKDNKLNSVYAKGGIELLYEVIEQNYGIRPDGYVLVGFDGFEKIIDRLGGVTVELTKEEAEYLNTTKYISKPEYRCVVPGKQNLNGSQTLGYCRVRKVPNINGTRYDYGRTERQRMVLESLFNRYVDAGIHQWVPILREVMGLVQTDISQELLEDILFAVYDNKITSFHTMQIPAAGTFESVDNKNGVTSVLVPDWEENRRLLQEFVFDKNEN